MKVAPRWLLAVVMAGGGVLGCQRGNQSDAPRDFFPLHAEDTWVYDVMRPLRHERTRLTVRARGDQFVAALNRRCQLVEESYAADAQNGGRAETYPIAYYRENGFLYRALSLEYRDGQVRDVGLGSEEERFLPEGLSGSLAWESRTTAYNLGPDARYGVTQNHRAAIDTAAVAVPAGRFSDCLRVETVAVHRGGPNDQGGALVTLYYTDWYAPNVGLVRTVQSSHADGGPALAEIDLVAYDVEGAR